MALFFTTLKTVLFDQGWLGALLSKQSWRGTTGI